MEIDLTKLCRYDRRNPDFEISEEYGYSPEEVAATGDFAKKDCFCDNCFYGRAELTEQLLKLQSSRPSLGIKIKRGTFSSPTALGLYKDTGKVIFRDPKDIPRGVDVVLCLENKEGNVIASDSEQYLPGAVIPRDVVTYLVKLLNEL